MQTTAEAAAFARPYIAYQTRAPIVVDGHLDEPAWQLAPKSPSFVDVVSGTPALYDTRAAVIWDASALYVGFWIEEPFVHGRQTERDSLVFLDNDVEVFIDGGDTYYEFEINALGTIYEVFFIWQDAYTRGGRFDVPEFDLLSRKTLSFGGNHDRSGAHFWWGTHARKARWAFLDWDFPGLQTAVHVGDTATGGPNPRPGWNVELAFPWAGMPWLANGRSLPPQDGDQWRLFIGRYQQLHISGQDHTVGWAWHPIGSADNHFPERFTPIQFSTTFL
ncbi:MAG TPA: carbohydrate-binding family 9-like protein [Roseiflexaceae bacterium]|nr:carbohydrate-binding family 9-like protein [Roseiflexaceae bacterium]